MTKKTDITDLKECQKACLAEKTCTGAEFDEITLGGGDPVDICKLWYLAGIKG